MTGLAVSCVFVVVLTLQICAEVRSGGIQGRRPYEERVANFHHQNVRNAIDIKGKVFVIKRNYRTSSRHRCLYSQRTERYSKTMYKFTLGSTPPYSRMYLVKFKTALQILKTGKHDTYNAVKYKIRPHDPHKVRKLMYVDKKASCMIFVDNRSSESEKASLVTSAMYATAHNDDWVAERKCKKTFADETIALRAIKIHTELAFSGCQLMRPARYADQPLPEQCQRVYKQNCHGESIKLYRRWCQALPERWYTVYKKRKLAGSRQKATEDMQE